jgi:diamine N-acetyltransferase
MEIDIRRADINDASLIAELSTVTFLDTFKGTCTEEDIQQFVSDCFNKEQVSKELQDPFDFYFIAFINDEAVGYMRLKEENSDVPVINKYKAIELKRMYVLKKYHDKKIGAALMKFAVAFAVEKTY